MGKLSEKKSSEFNRLMAILMLSVSTVGIILSQRGSLDKRLITSQTMGENIFSSDCQYFYDNCEGVCSQMLLSGDLDSYLNKLQSSDNKFDVVVNNLVSDECFLAFKNATNYLNEIFKIINPDYTFAISKQNSLVKNGGDILIMNSADDNSEAEGKAVMRTNVSRFKFGVFDNAKNINGKNYGKDATIEILDVSGLSQSKLNYIALHEFLHVLGFKDHESSTCNKPHRSLIDYSDLGDLEKLCPNQLFIYPKDMETLIDIYFKDNKNLNETMTNCSEFYFDPNEKLIQR